jgi:hypothetical protein
MAAYENLPIFRKALELAVHMEDIVMRFRQQDNHGKRSNLKCAIYPRERG